MARLFTFISIISFLFSKPVSATGVSTIKIPRDVLQVLPNPGNGIFTIMYKSDTKGAVNLAVTDATGKYVYLKTVRDFNGELKEILDLSGLPKGIYIVEAERENGRETKKIIHQ
jgi:endoglucanase